MTTSSRYQHLASEGLDDIMRLVNDAAGSGGELVAFLTDRDGNYVAVMDSTERVAPVLDEGRGSSV